MPFPGLGWMLVWGALVSVQDDSPIPPTPFDRELLLELTADDPSLIDGRGPTQVVEYTAEFEGTLHVWTSSELDLSLRVEDASTTSLLAEDDDSGGGSTPYVRLEVERGQRVALFVAGSAGEGAVGELLLRLIAAPETAKTREAGAAARGTLDEVARLRADGDLASARDVLSAAVESLRDFGDVELSQVAADVFWDMGIEAHRLNSTDLRLEAWGRAHRHRERTLPEDHPDLLSARNNLAGSMHVVGDLAGARALREAVLAGYERTLPADHPDLLLARNNLANSMHQMGDLAGARALSEAVLAGYERTRPADHPDLLRARANLANSMSQMGDLAGACALEEAVLAGYERTLPADHPDLLRALANLAGLMSDMGDLAGARALFPPLCGGMRARVLASLSLAPRQARQTVAAEGQRLASVRFWSESAGSELRAAVFELTETMRLVAGEAARSLARFGTDPELAPILAEAASVRRAQGDLIAGVRQGDQDGESIAGELTRLSLERDRLEREASRRLTERGVVTRPVEVGALSNALAPSEVVVGYRRMAHWYDDETSGRVLSGPDHLLAHVLRADRSLSRVDLGPAAELEELVTEWRAALGAPLLRGVGLGDDDDLEADAGARLRERILDPVLVAAGDDVRRLFVCADDLAFLVPLEALPLDVDGDERVGDRVRLVSEVSFARLLATQSHVESEPSLLAFGGVDHDADGAAPEGFAAASAPIDDDGASDADATRESRGAIPERFQNLVQTRYEVETTARLFEDAFEVEPTLLTRKETTKAALFEAAGAKRFVHLATHGWFAPETVKSTEDAQPVAPGRALMTAEERVTGFAPMTLCGLALAGANGGRDPLGRVPGILTAEELCSLDLSQCELAVLSACETNVGIRRAGQGIQSLQAALYAAGARTSITSLWKVDDAATRRLFEVFYSNLWLEGMPKAEALWQAKTTLREEGHPPRDWAGWVMTGEPD